MVLFTAVRPYHHGASDHVATPGEVPLVTLGEIIHEEFGTPRIATNQPQAPEPVIERVTIALSSTAPEDVAETVATLLTLIRPSPPTVVTADEGRRARVRFDAIAGSPASGVTRLLGGRIVSRDGRPVPFVAPFPTGGNLFRRGASWDPVPSPGDATGRAPVRLDARLAPPHRVLVVADLVDHPRGSPIAILSRYVHPRDRLHARLADGDPLAVNAAFGFVIALVVVIAAAPNGQRRIAVTTDLLAAELVAVALGARGPEHDGAVDHPGSNQPWEDATVQRATAASLGVDHPSRLALADATPPDDHAALGGAPDHADWVIELATRLGVPASAIGRAIY